MYFSIFVGRKDMKINMDFIKTKIDGVIIVEPKVFGDHRGFFMESYSKREFEKAGRFYDFVQDNHSS